MTAPLPLSYPCDTTELALLLTEFGELVRALGYRTTERVLGRSLDSDLFFSFVQIERCVGEFRAVPTPEFERALTLLWDALYA